MVTLVVNGLAGMAPELVTATSNLAKTQHEVGEWSVNGAAFVLISILIIITALSAMYLLIRNLISQQQRLLANLSDNSNNEQLVGALDRNSEILDKVAIYLKQVNNNNHAKAVRQGTYSQLHFAMTEALEGCKRKVVLSCNKIISDNHIDNKGNIEMKVKRIAKNAYDNMVAGFNSFDFSDRRAGELIPYSLTGTIADLMLAYIYSQPRSIDRLNADLDIAFDDALLEFLQILGNSNSDGD